jgi:Spy/CpxP family protein refolding chaperone
MIKIIFASAALSLLFKAGPAAAQAAADQNASAAPADMAAQAPATADAAADDQASAELREHHRHHHQGGITQFIAMSLDTLGADEAKRPRLERIQRELHRCMAPAGRAEKGVLRTIADGVAAGSIDAAKVDAGIEKVATAAGDAQPCSIKALNRLHKLLSAEERQALVDKVQAHYEVWRQVNHEAEFGGQEKGGRLAELAKELSLTPDQVDKISAQLKAAQAPSKFDPAKAEAHLKAFADAFVSDSFDAKSILANANGHLAAHGAKRMAAFYEAVGPVLTPDQRTALAAHLREHSGHQPSAS